jgi:uncharacterized protein YjiS (DUF1127 family)
MRNYGLNTADHAPAPVPGLVACVLEWLADRLALLAREQQARRQIETLRHLSDHVLRDMGLDRADIVWTVRFGRFGSRHDE